MTVQTALFYRFGVALFIGILVGLQREFTYDTEEKADKLAFAGVRTFSLLALLGAAGAYASDLLDSPFVFLGVTLVFGSLITVAYFVTSSRGDVGMTTEVAAVLIFFAGALSYWNQVALAVALAVATTALLSFKLELHRLAERLSREDILATLKFAIITAIVLPVLPNQSYWDPPFDVLNPYKIWLMVVLISAIGFLGYVLYKVLGSRRGISLTGLLGGLVSSTATTLSFAQRSQKGAQLTKPFALAIVIAWTMMFGRVAVEVIAIHTPLLEEVWLPLLLTGGAALAFAGYLYLAPHDQGDEEDLVVTNPFELRPAVTFGLLYGLILLVARTAQLFFGDAGIYASSFVAGFADVDAITVSMAELSRSGNLDMDVGGRAIILAVMANTLAKGGIVIAAGSGSLRRAILPGVLLILAVGALSAILL
jgi:uncharacterized membrane protein (DUF4010 family)